MVKVKKKIGVVLFVMVAISVVTTAILTYQNNSSKTQETKRKPIQSQTFKANYDKAGAPEWK